MIVCHIPNHRQVIHFPHFTNRIREVMSFQSLEYLHRTAVTKLTPRLLHIAAKRGF